MSQEERKKEKYKADKLVSDFLEKAEAGEAGSPRKIKNVESLMIYGELAENKNPGEKEKRIAVELLRTAATSVPKDLIDLFAAINAVQIIADQARLPIVVRAAENMLDYLTPSILDQKPLIIDAEVEPEIGATDEEMRGWLREIKELQRGEPTLSKDKMDQLERFLAMCSIGKDYRP